MPHQEATDANNGVPLGVLLHQLSPTRAGKPRNQRVNTMVLPRSLLRHTASTTAAAAVAPSSSPLPPPTVVSPLESTLLTPLSSSPPRATQLTTDPPHESGTGGSLTRPLWQRLLVSCASAPTFRSGSTQPVIPLSQLRDMRRLFLKSTKEREAFLQEARKRREKEEYQALRQFKQAAQADRDFKLKKRQQSVERTDSVSTMYTGVTSAAVSPCERGLNAPVTTMPTPIRGGSVVPPPTHDLLQPRRVSISLQGAADLGFSRRTPSVGGGGPSLQYHRRSSVAPMGSRLEGPSWDERYREYERSQRRLGRKLLARIQRRAEEEERAAREAIALFRSNGPENSDFDNPANKVTVAGVGDSPLSDRAASNHADRPGVVRGGGEEEPRAASATPSLNTSDSDLDPRDAKLLAYEEQGLLEDEDEGGSMSRSLSPDGTEDVRQLLKRHNDHKLDHDPDSTIGGISSNYWSRRFPVVPTEQLFRPPQHDGAEALDDGAGVRAVEASLAELYRNQESERRQAKKDALVEEANKRYRTLVELGITNSNGGGDDPQDSPLFRCRSVYEMRSRLRSAENRRVKVAVKHHLKELVRQHQQLVGGDAGGTEVGMALLLEEAQSAVHAHQKFISSTSTSSETLRAQFKAMWREQKERRERWWDGGDVSARGKGQLLLSDSDEDAAENTFLQEEHERNDVIDELDVDAFVAAFGSFLSTSAFTPPEAELRQWFHDIDVDANGTVSWEEFTTFIVGQSSSSSAVAGADAFVDDDAEQRKQREAHRRQNKRFGKSSIEVAMLASKTKEGIPDFSKGRKRKQEAKGVGGARQTILVSHEAHEQLARAKEFTLVTNPTAKHFLNTNSHKNLSVRIAVTQSSAAHPGGHGLGRDDDEGDIKAAAHPFAVSCGKDGYLQVYHPSTCESVQTVNNSAHSASRHLTKPSPIASSTTVHLEDFGSRRKPQGGSSQSVSAIPCTDAVFNSRGTHLYVSSEDKSVNCYEFVKVEKDRGCEGGSSDDENDSGVIHRGTGRDTVLPGGFQLTLRRKYIGVGVQSGAAYRHPALFSRQLQMVNAAPNTKSTDPHVVFSRRTVLTEGSNVDTTALLGMAEAPTSMDLSSGSGQSVPASRTKTLVHRVNRTGDVDSNGDDVAQVSEGDFMLARAAAEAAESRSQSFGRRELFYFGFPSGAVVAYPTLRQTRTQEIAAVVLGQVHGRSHSENGPSNTLGDGCGSISKIRFVSSMDAVLTSSWDTTARLSDAETLQVVTTYGQAREPASPSPLSRASVLVLPRLVNRTYSHSTTVSNSLVSPLSKPTGGSSSWGHTKAVTDFAFSTFHRVLATGGNDRRVLLWSLAGNFATPIAELTGHAAPIVALTIDAEDSLLFSLDAENTIKAWDLRATHNGALQSFSALTGNSSGDDTGCGDNTFASTIPRTRSKSSALSAGGYSGGPKSLAEICSTVTYHPHSHRLLGVGVSPVFYTSTRALSGQQGKPSIKWGSNVSRAGGSVSEPKCEVGGIPFKAEPAEDMYLFTSAVEPCVSKATGEVKISQRALTQEGLYRLHLSREDKERKEAANRILQDTMKAAQALKDRRQWLRMESVQVDASSSHLAHTGPIVGFAYAAPTASLVTFDSDVTAVWKGECGRRSLLWDNSSAGHAHLCGGVGLDLPQRRVALVSTSGVVTVFNYRSGQLLLTMNPAASALYHALPSSVLPQLHHRSAPSSTAATVPPPPAGPADFTSEEPLRVALLGNAERTIRTVVVVYPRGLILADESFSKEDPTSQAAKELVTSVPFPGSSRSARFTCSTIVPAAGSLTCCSLVLGTSDGQLLCFQPTVQGFSGKMQHPTSTTRQRRNSNASKRFSTSSLDGSAALGLLLEDGAKESSLSSAKGNLVEDVAHLASKDLVVSVVGTSMIFFWDITKSSLRYACDLRVLLAGCPHRQIFDPSRVDASKIRDSTVALVCVAAVDKAQLLEEDLWNDVITERSAAHAWERFDQRAVAASDLDSEALAGSESWVRQSPSTSPAEVNIRKAHATTTTVADSLKLMSPDLYSGGATLLPPIAPPPHPSSGAVSSTASSSLPSSSSMPFQPARSELFKALPSGADDPTTISTSETIPPHMANLARRKRAPLTSLVVAGDGGILYILDVASLPQCEAALRFFHRRVPDKARRSVTRRPTLSSSDGVSHFDPSLVTLSHVFSSVGRCYHMCEGMELACPPAVPAFEVAAAYPQSTVTSLALSARHRCIFVGSTTSKYHYFSNLHTVSSGLRALAADTVSNSVWAGGSDRRTATSDATFLTGVVAAEGDRTCSPPATATAPQLLCRRYPLLVTLEGPTEIEEGGAGCVRVLSWQGEWVGVVGQEQRWAHRHRFSFADPFAHPDTWLQLPSVPTNFSDEVTSASPAASPPTPGSPSPLGLHQDSTAATSSPTSPSNFHLAGAAEQTTTSVRFLSSPNGSPAPDDTLLPREHFHFARGSITTAAVQLPHHNEEEESDVVAPPPRPRLKGKCAMSRESHKHNLESRPRHRRALLKESAYRRLSNNARAYAHQGQSQRSPSGPGGLIAQSPTGGRSGGGPSFPSLEATAVAVSAPLAFLGTPSLSPRHRGSLEEDDVGTLTREQSEIAMLVSEAPTVPLGVRAAKVRMRVEGSANSSTTLELQRRHYAALAQRQQDAGSRSPSSSSSSSSEGVQGDLRHHLKVHARLKLRLENTKSNKMAGRARRAWSERPSYALTLQKVEIAKPKLPPPSTAEGV